jgi:hypothetical protein
MNREPNIRPQPVSTQIISLSPFPLRPPFAPVQTDCSSAAFVPFVNCCEEFEPEWNETERFRSKMERPPSRGNFVGTSPRLPVSKSPSTQPSNLTPVDDPLTPMTSTIANDSKTPDGLTAPAGGAPVGRVPGTSIPSFTCSSTHKLGLGSRGLPFPNDKPTRGRHRPEQCKTNQPIKKSAQQPSRLGGPEGFGALGVPRRICICRGCQAGRAGARKPNRLWSGRPNKENPILGLQRVRNSVSLSKLI